MPQSLKTTEKDCLCCRAGFAKYTSIRFAGLLALLCVLLYMGAGTASEISPENPDVAAKPISVYDSYWLKAKDTVNKSVMTMLTQHQAELDLGIRLHKLMHGDRSQKYVAFTFDDGPHPTFTPRLLALLKLYQVKATFFVVGKMAERYPSLLQAEVADGHCIGNHTYDHENLTKLSPDKVTFEISACNEVVKRITGQTPHLFRPPGGAYNHQVAEISEALHTNLVLWSNDPGDYAQPGTQVIERRLLSQTPIQGGAIILLHDGVDQTLDLLPHLFATLRLQGYEFVTLDQMITSMNNHSASNPTSSPVHATVSQLLAKAPIPNNADTQPNDVQASPQQPVSGAGVVSNTKAK